MDIADLIKKKMKEAAGKSGSVVITKTSSVEGGDEADEALNDALGDVFDAIKADDREAGISALKAAIQICKDQDYPDSDEE